MWENVRARVPALPQLPLNAHVSPEYRGPGRSRGCLGYLAFSICQEGSKDINLQKPTINSFDEVSWHQWNQKSSSVCVSSPSMYLGAFRIREPGTLAELVPRLHASLLAGWARSPSLLSACVDVWEAENREYWLTWIQVIQSSTWSEVRCGVCPCVRVRLRAHHPWLIFPRLSWLLLSQPEVPVCGAPVCQEHTRVLLSSLLGNHTSPALWPLFRFCFDPGWLGGCWAVAWLHVALSNPLVVVGPWVGWFWGQCQQEGWSLCRNLRLCSRTGMRAGQAGVVKGRLVWCRLDQQPWQLPFPRWQQWRLPTEHLPCKKAPWCASCKH